MNDLPYKCKDCNHEFDLHFPVELIICPECGSENVTFCGNDINA